MLLVELKESFYDYLKQLEQTDLNLLYENVNSFLDEFKNKNEQNNSSISQQPLDSSNETPIEVASSTSLKEKTPSNENEATELNTEENNDHDHEPETFNEQVLQDLIKINESEVGLISKKSKRAKKESTTATKTKPTKEATPKPKLRLKLNLRRSKLTKKTTKVRRRKLPFKRRKSRVSYKKGFTLDVINTLVKEFHENDYPDTKKKQELSEKLNLTMQQIHYWFRNRRKKLNIRRRIPSHLTNYLIKEFNKNKSPTDDDLKIIMAKTKLPLKCIQNWFEMRRNKKERVKRTYDCVDYLKKKYNENKYPSKTQIRKMSDETGLTTKKLNIWFRSHRTRLKHTHLKGFTPKVQEFLQEKYNENKYPDALAVHKMSLECNVSTFQINNWFKRRRFVLRHTNMNKFSPQVVEYLTQNFNHNNNPTPNDILLMAIDTSLTTNEITQWFNDTRHKLKRQTKIIQVVTNESQIESIEVKKTRSAKYSKEIVDMLVKAYEENKYPDNKKIQELVSETNLATRQILTWFNDRRKKFKQTTPNRFPQHVVDYLLKNYEADMYPSSEEIEKMALHTRLTTQQVNQWYMHKRHKCKKTRPKKNKANTNNATSGNDNTNTTMASNASISLVTLSNETIPDLNELTFTQL